MANYELQADRIIELHKSQTMRYKNVYVPNQADDNLLNHSKLQFLNLNKDIPLCSSKFKQAMLFERNNWTHLLYNILYWSLSPLRLLDTLTYSLYIL